MVMYRVVRHISNIEAVVIEKATGKTVWYKRQFSNGEERVDKELKSSQHYEWFATFEEAKEYLISTREMAIRSYEYSLKAAKEDLIEVKALTEKEPNSKEIW